MKKFILALLVLAISFSACNQGKPFNAARQAVIDDAAIKAYIKANNIAAVKDSSGLYYQIIKPGAGANAMAGSTVSVNYIGKLLNGSIFDQSTSPFVTSLRDVIPGWTIGVPLVKNGGKILLIIPSALGYGNAAAGPIPENSVLVFTIDVLSIK